MGETRNAGDGNNIIVAGKRGDKTAKMAETIKQYIGGFSKREKQLITEALEQEAAEEEPPLEQANNVISNWYDYTDLKLKQTQLEWQSGQLEFFGVPAANAPTITTSTTAGTSPFMNYKVVFNNDGLGWLTNPQKKEIEEDVQDVDFSEE
jgi:hypothetical protein